MTRVFALFDRDDMLQEAQDALEQVGLTADVERVIDPGATPAVGQPAAVVAPIATDGRHDGVMPLSAHSNWLSEFDVDDDEARFLGDAVSGGASLIVVNTAEPDAVEEIFSRTGGSRIFRKG